MAQVNIPDYVEGNKTNVYATPGKNAGTEVFVGDLAAGGVVTVNVERDNSQGIFIGVDGHRN